MYHCNFDTLEVVDPSSAEVCFAVASQDSSDTQYVGVVKNVTHVCTPYLAPHFQSHVYAHVIRMVIVSDTNKVTVFDTNETSVYGHTCISMPLVMALPCWPLYRN